MRSFDRIRAHKPENIENRNGHIVGGGIAGLAAAVFPIDDGYMPWKNITIYAQLYDVGGSVDGATNARSYWKLFEALNSIPKVKDDDMIY